MADNAETPQFSAVEMLAALPLGVVATDNNGRVTYINDVARSTADLGTAQIVSRPLSDLLRALVTDSQQPEEIEKQLLGNSMTVCLMLRHSQAACAGRRLELCSKPLLGVDGQRIGFIITIADRSFTTDIPHLGQQQDIDPLTGLMGRRDFEQRLGNLIQDACSSSRSHALLLMDMDQFKLVNDLSGHHAGDVLLQQMAQLLEDEIHKGDTLARLGGDEFALLLSNVETGEAVSVARRLMAAVQAMPFTWDGRAYPLSVSVGVVPITEDIPQPTMSLSRADTALYAAKDQGRNRLNVYQAGSHELKRRHGEMEWVSQINAALDEGLFRLAIQPIASLQRQEPGTHFEVLLRMQYQGKLITPGEFIPAAERYGIMNRVDRWVINRFLDYLQLHPDQFNAQATCALNLSGQSLLDEDFLPYMRQQLSRPGIHTECLCFEVTETAAISNFQQALRFVEDIRALGCQFSLDDFGSGMSSFGYLRQFPVDYLKIDGVFVRDMDTDPVHAAMVKSINEIGHAMGKKTIAEFVTNEVIQRMLREMGVDYAQGYYIGEPSLLAA